MEVTNILTGKDDHEEEEDMETIFTNILTSLGMTENQLKSCHGKTATLTARHIMILQYPNPEPDFKFKEINESIIDSIIQYARIANPADQASDSEIKHAMGNYVAAYVYKNKLK
ncbi:unnamed protein product [Rotaria sp. Silwood2]|nr:unnamed protein product [Rotaria sp. Silwood2]